MLVDPRDVEQELYKIEYIEGTNEAVLYKPAFPAPIRKDATEYDPRQPNDQVKTGHKVARSSYERLAPEERYRKVILRWDDDVKLTESPSA
ncbi:hypothetical protein SEMRO_712_G191280.1 [Seminavis robusta]|uniref:Uncharacterized protein n=1 Tax=Seminavis robusta TaxID=568900 RepID=A0A9N8EA09_9STRA|nr:hypothetical protein SEMRO_712_G191280.1 [Seminavis robusta]|eukprot:Sro712_g191280.1 n/a (91) ;mRNA; r:2705-2977